VRSNSSKPKRTSRGASSSVRIWKVSGEAKSAKTRPSSSRVEPGELINEGGVTILEEREGNRVRVVRRYDDYTLDMSYDTSRLDEAYRLILEGWDGWEEFRRHMPALEEKFGREWVVEFLSRVVRARLTGEKFVPPDRRLVRRDRPRRGAQ
jgi:hypothetical protein